MEAKKKTFMEGFGIWSGLIAVFCMLDKTWACLHVCVRTRGILPSFPGSRKPFLHQNLENMPSQCSLTWWCGYRGWVVACLIINRSSGIGKENTLWCMFQIPGGSNSHIEGRKRRLEHGGVGIVVEWGHHIHVYTSKWPVHLAVERVESWSLFLYLARPLSTFTRRFCWSLVVLWLQALVALSALGNETVLGRRTAVLHTIQCGKGFTTGIPSCRKGTVPLVLPRCIFIQCL